MLPQASDNECGRCWAGISGLGAVVLRVNNGLSVSHLRMFTDTHVLYLRAVLFLSTKKKGTSTSVDEHNITNYYVHLSL